MSDPTYEKRLKKFADAPFFRHFPRWAGGLVAGLGVVVMIGWLAHWRPVVQIMPQLAPMKFNTALCFLFCGLAFVLPERHQRRFMPIFGGVAGVVGFLTLLEYFSGADFHVDQLFVKDYIASATLFPGRMSQLSASCFILLSVGMWLGTLSRAPHRRFTVPGLAAGIVKVIAAVALFGYLFGIEAAYGWGAYTRMALHTALGFFVMGGALLIWTWQRARRDNFNFLRWLPVTASVTLMVMVAFVSAVNMGELQSASYWRQHTYRVLAAADELQSHYIEAQRGMRGYVAAGAADSLAAYKTGRENTEAQLGHLLQFTRDNHDQRQRLQTLSGALAGVWDYNDRLIALYGQQGAETVFEFEKSGTGRVLSGQALDAIKEFMHAERTLLDRRDLVEQADYHDAENLLIFGSVLAALLLVFANWMASHELAIRQRMENQLSRALLLQNAILNSADYGIVTTNPKGIIQTYNAAAEEMFGYPAGEIIGKNTPLLWHDPREIAERAEKLSKKLGLPVRANFEAIAMKVQFDQIDEGEWTFVRKDGTRFTSSLVVTALAGPTGAFTGFLGIFRDITDRKKFEAEREKLILELRDALAKVKTLSGLIPICGWCKKVRTDEGYMQTVEQYILAHTDATFSHGMCPECSEKFKADIVRANAKEQGLGTPQI